MAESILSKLWHWLDEQFGENPQGRSNNRSTTTNSDGTFTNWEQGQHFSLLNELTSMIHAFTGSELTNAQREQNAVNEQMARNAFDREMYAYANRYQMSVADMEAAGLNPALMYGGQGLGPSTVSPQATGQTVMPGQGMSQILDLVMKTEQLQIEKYKADTERIGVTSETELNDSIISWNEAKSKGQSILNEIAAATKDFEIEKAKSDLDIKKELVGYYNAYKELVLAQINFIDLQMLTEEQRAGLAAAEAFFKNAQAWQIGQVTAPLIKLYNSESFRNYEQARLLGKEADIAQFEKQMTQEFYEKGIFRIAYDVAKYDANIKKTISNLTEDKYNDAFIHGLMMLGLSGGDILRAGVTAGSVGVIGSRYPRQ